MSLYLSIERDLSIPESDIFRTIGPRLRQEREKLGFTQEDFAALVHVSRKAQMGWEKDATSPNAVILAAMAAAGVDVLYVVTGRREGLSHSDEMDRLAALTLQDLFDLIADIQTGLPLLDDLPSAVAKGECDGDLRMLQIIAAHPYLHDKARARADQLLSILFNDANAHLRCERRMRVAAARTAHAYQLIDMAIKAVGRSPGEVVREMLAALIRHVDLEESDVVLLVQLYLDREL